MDIGQKIGEFKKEVTEHEEWLEKKRIELQTFQGEISTRENYLNNLKQFISNLEGPNFGNGTTTIKGTENIQGSLV